MTPCHFGGWKQVKALKSNTETTSEQKTTGEEADLFWPDKVITSGSPTIHVN